MYCFLQVEKIYDNVSFLWASIYIYIYIYITFNVRGDSLTQIRLLQDGNLPPVKGDCWVQKVKFSGDFYLGCLRQIRE